MELDIRYITEDEVLASHKTVSRAFGSHGDESMVPLMADALKDGRGLAAFEGNDIVGFAIAYPLEMSVEGRMLPTTLVDSVAVPPTHRRRGILNKLMDFHLRDFHERGETLSCLGASESSIYGRYGYGVGSVQVDFSIDRHNTALAHGVTPAGSCRFVDKLEAMSLFPEVSERACSNRSGFLKGIESMWNFYLSDHEFRRSGASEYFHVAYEEDGRVDGYVTYRMGNRTVMIHEMITVTNEAHAALWQYCFGIDLVDRIEAPKRPVDDPLPWMLADPRRLRQSLRDDLWLRLVNVREALGKRTYAGEGRVVFDVKDTFCPWNEASYELEGGPRGSECFQTTKPSGISVSAADLGAAYLGATTFTALARAGRAQENSEGAFAIADGMFKASLQPWWPNEF